MTPVGRRLGTGTCGSRKGHATDPQIRFRSSAGGGLSALALSPESGRVDFILPCRRLGPKSRCARNGIRASIAAQVMEARDRGYGPAAPLVDFSAAAGSAAARSPSSESPAMSAAVRNPAGITIRASIDWLMPCWRFVCGGASSSVPKTRDLVEGFGLERRTRSRYCAIAAWAIPGSRASRPRMGARSRRPTTSSGGTRAKWMLQFRCKICADAIGELGGHRGLGRLAGRLAQRRGRRASTGSSHARRRDARAARGGRTRRCAGADRRPGFPLPR